MGTKYEKDHARSKPVEAMLGALIGISTVLMIQLLSFPALDRALNVSLYSVAVSIPTLSACLLIEFSETHAKFSEEMWYHLPIMIIGIVATVIAIASAFLHFSIYAAGAFIALSFWGLIFWSVHIGVVKRANQP